MSETRTCTTCGVSGDVSLFCKDKRYSGGYRNRCKECSNAQVRKWKNKNPEYMQEYLKSYGTDYREANRHKLNNKEATRRARKLKQTPDLTDEERKQVEYLYWLAKDLKAVSGEEYHVDHVHPLAKGGLHHPNNLQILPADINLRKGCKVPDNRSIEP